MNDPRRARLTDEAEDIEATPVLLVAAEAPELPGPVVAGGTAPGGGDRRFARAAICTLTHCALSKQSDRRDRS